MVATLMTTAEFYPSRLKIKSQPICRKHALAAGGQRYVNDARLTVCLAAAA